MNRLLAVVMLSVALAGAACSLKVPMGTPTRQHAGPDIALAAQGDHADPARVGTLAWYANRATQSGERTELALIGPHTYRVVGDLTLPPDMTLRFEHGAIVQVADNATLTLNCGVIAGPWRIFRGAGRVVGKPRVDFVRPQWWGTDADALQAAVRFKRVHLGTGQYTIDRRIIVGSDTHITGEPGCLVTSTRAGMNLHEGFFTNLPIGKGSDEPGPVRNLTIEGVKFKNTTATGIFGLALFTGKGQTHENIRFVNCEAVGGGLLNVNNVKNILIKDNFCHSSTLEQEKYEVLGTTGDYPKFDNQNGIYLGGGVIEDAIIVNNRILGPRCHGICVVSAHVYNRTYEDRDPDQSFPGKRILIQGNTVAAPPNNFCAGGIFVGFVQDCRIVGNHVEGYNDVGIDFEGSRNGIADSNVLIDNGKSLALYGNNKNITFSNNIVTISEDKDNPFFQNMYSNSGDDPPITDIRQTDIFVTGNTFWAKVDTYKRSWTGAIVTGTARRLYIRNNNFINAHFMSHFCDDLETIEVTGNSFYNNIEGDSTAPLYLAVAERDKTKKQPTKNYIISNNHFRSVNDAGISSIILVATGGGTEGSAPYCDLNVVINGNIVDRETTAGKSAIAFQHNYDWGYADQMKVNCVIRNNVTSADIDIKIPEHRREAVNLVLEGNTRLQE